MASFHWGWHWHCTYLTSDQVTSLSPLRTHALMTTDKAVKTNFNRNKQVSHDECVHSSFKLSTLCRPECEPNGCLLSAWFTQSKTMECCWCVCKWTGCSVEETVNCVQMEHGIIDTTSLSHWKWYCCPSPKHPPCSMHNNQHYLAGHPR